MAKFVEFLINVTAILVLCQEGFSIRIPNTCFLLCKQHLNGFSMQSRHFIGANSKFVKRGCDCTKFHSYLRTRRAIHTTKPPATTSSYSMASTSTAKPTQKLTKGINERLQKTAPKKNIHVLTLKDDISGLNLTRRNSVFESLMKNSTTLRKLLESFIIDEDKEENSTKYCRNKAPTVGDDVMTVTNESQLRAPNVGVSFYFDKKSWWANVSWSVPQGINFTGFLIFWDDNTHDVYQQLNQQCRQLPKNVKSILLSEADGTWKYPNTLSILVGILPAYYFKSHQLVMEPFYPPISTTTKPAVALTSSSDDGRCNYKSVGPENTRVLNESEYLAPNIDVTFHEIDNTWLVNTTWSPPEDANFTEYIFYWTSGDIKHKCRLLPKNVTFLVLAEADGIWKYPSEFNVLVVLLPAYNYHSGGPKDGTDYKHFFPPLPSFPTITLEPPRERRMQHGAIVAGVLAGILFIVVLLVLIYKRKTCGASQPHHHIIIPMQDNNNADALTKVNNTSKPQNVDTYFASYLPESEKYSTDVATIAYKLGLMGYKVVFDKVDSVRMNEIGFNMWVDKHILESKKYIVFCSTGYVKLWQSLASSVSSENRFNHVSDQDLVRVRYEIKRISDVYSENCSTSRIICIKMDSKMSTKLLPPWMNHNMLSWPEEKEDIIRRMNDQAAMVMHV